MPNEPTNLGDHFSATASTERLDSWKEIAAYLKHSERTVRRWENEGLPIHRHPHKKKPAIYAYKPEIDRWWNDGRVRLEELERPNVAGWPRWLQGLVVASLVLVTLAAATYWVRNRIWPLRRGRVLTEKDTIVLGDFVNSTGDPVFDGTLRQGLAVQLEQSPFFSILSDDQVAATLRLMEKPPDARLTHGIAREVCQRANATAVVEGSIAALGNEYVVGLDAVSCGTGNALAQEQVTADRKEDVLGALGKAASKLRSKLGESSASLQAYDLPLAQVTTPSLEALQAFTLGLEAIRKGDLESGISLLQRAVGLDGDFAAAYSALGDAYSREGQLGLGADNATRAYQLRDRASEREKLDIMSNYYLSATGELEKAVQIGEQWTKIYPRDTAPYISLTNTYTGVGRWEDSLSAAREALRRDPSQLTYHNVAAAAETLGRMDEALATIQQAEANHVDPAIFRDVLYAMAFIQNDAAAMDRQLTAPWMLTFNLPPSAEQAQSWTLAYHGQLVRSRDLRERAATSARQRGAENLVASYEVAGALIDALVGDLPEARKTIKSTPEIPMDRDLEGAAAIVWALVGDTARAQKLTNDLEKRFPGATYLRFGGLPTIHGLLALDQGNSDEATETLKAISSHELVPP